MEHSMSEAVLEPKKLEKMIEYRNNSTWCKVWPQPVQKLLVIAIDA